MRFAKRSLAPALALLAANVYITLRLFHTEYMGEMGSIEAAFIALARYIRGHFWELNWFPLWYGGIPYPDSYPPLLHWMVAGTSWAADVSPALAYHFVTALVFSVTPVALFWTAWRLGASRLAAFGGALGYSLFSLSAWLIPAIREDSDGWAGPHRLIVLVRWGEGPHLTSMLFLVLSIGLLHAARERRTPLRFVGAAVALAATVLSNWIGAFALALAVSAYLLAYVSKGSTALWVRTAAIGLYAYALALPWTTPATVATIGANAPLVIGNFEDNAMHRVLVAVFAAGMLLLAWAVRRAGVPAAARFGILFFYGTAFIALAAYWFHLLLLPQPQRYHMEMDLAFWLALSLGAAPVARLVRGYRRRMKAAMAMAALCLPAIVSQRNLARTLEKAFDVRGTVEYKVSRWLGEHMPGRRVYAPGSISFWMDAFSDTPLLNGGFDNGRRNRMLPFVNYQLLVGGDREVSLAWLEAYGCEAVVGGDPQSAEVYHPFRHPEQYHGLPELWRDGPEVIYGVPWRRRSLAHAVRASDLVQVQPTTYDARPLKPYLQALEDPALPAASFEWRGPNAARVTGALRPEHLLSIQVTWDEGWKASVGGQARRVWGDKLGQMVVEPRCSGACTVDLLYDGGTEMRAARWISGLTWICGILWIVAGLWRKRSDLTTTN